MGKIYLIRHGETDSNKGHRFQGRMNLPLNSKGMQQSALLEQYMQHLPVDAVYCSSMLRACMTAAPLAMQKNIAYHPLELLQEVSFGAWEGLEYSEITKRWPKEMEAFLTRPGEWIPPQGESFHDAAQRCREAFDYIFAREGHEKNIAIVSHGGIIRVQLSMILGMPLNNLWKLSVHNVSISTVNDWQGNMVVEAINDAHFAKAQGNAVNWLHQ